MTYRVCDICGGVDEHPRHSFAGVIPGVHEVRDELRQTVSDNVQALYDDNEINFDQAAAIMASFLDTTSSDRHIDCCASVGCMKAGTPEGCDARVAVWNGVPGEGMVEAARTVRAQQQNAASEEKE